MINGKQLCETDSQKLLPKQIKCQLPLCFISRASEQQGFHVLKHLLI